MKKAFTLIEILLVLSISVTLKKIDPKVYFYFVKSTVTWL